jgi:hypothetical protein
MESKHEKHEDYMKRKLKEFEERDMVNSPAHYADGNIETIDYIVDVLGDYEAISYCQGNVIKYTGSRLWKKGKPVEDARKAIWYLEKMIELLEKTEGVNW